MKLDLAQFIGKEAKDISQSPFGKLLNPTLLAVSEGKLKVSFVVREEFTNPIGTLHGGVTAGLMDELFGITTFTLQREGFYMSINIQVDFLRPGVKGETLIAETEIIKDGRNTAHAECKIYNSQNKLIAKGSSNLILTEAKINP
ncbi:MAG: PaaI family thioesterase [Leadbetterella sp.]